MKYYHGGGRGYKEILPPDLTGASSTADYTNKLCDKGKVYMTTCFDSACVYAAMYPKGKGVVYEVEPVGEVYPDEDYIPDDGGSVCAERAKIIKVHKLSGKKIKYIRKVFLEGQSNDT